MAESFVCPTLPSLHTSLPPYPPTYLPASHLPPPLPSSLVSTSLRTHLPTYLPTHLPTLLPSHHLPRHLRESCPPSLLPSLPTYLLPPSLPTATSSRNSRRYLLMFQRMNSLSLTGQRCLFSSLVTSSWNLGVLWSGASNVSLNTETRKFSLSTGTGPLNLMVTTAATPTEQQCASACQQRFSRHDEATTPRRARSAPVALHLHCLICLPYTSHECSKLLPFSPWVHGQLTYRRSASPPTARGR